MGAWTRRGARLGAAADGSLRVLEQALASRRAAPQRTT
jgi:hypothetical protein